MDRGVLVVIRTFGPRGRFFVKDVVCGHMDESGPRLGCGSRQRGRAEGVDREGLLLVPFGLVRIRPRRCVDDDVV